MIFIAVLFGLLGLLLQWWLNKKESGRQPTEREIRNTERIFGRIEKIKALAVPMGCRPEGIDDDDREAAVDFANLPVTHPIVAAFAEAMTVDDAAWRPGGLISDKLYEFVINQYVLPYMRKKWPDMPGTDDAWKPWLLAQIKESQS